MFYARDSKSFPFFCIAMTKTAMNFRLPFFAVRVKIPLNMIRLWIKFGNVHDNHTTHVIVWLCEWERNRKRKRLRGKEKNKTATTEREDEKLASTRQRLTQFRRKPNWFFEYGLAQPNENNNETWNESENAAKDVFQWFRRWLFSSLLLLRRCSSLFAGPIVL